MSKKLCKGIELPFLDVDELMIYMVWLNFAKNKQCLALSEKAPLSLSMYLIQRNNHISVYRTKIH